MVIRFASLFICMIVIILLYLSAIAIAEENRDKYKDKFINKTVAEVIKCYNVKYDALKFVDEPPGKLKELIFVTNVNKNKHRVILYLNYSNDLFSPDFKWNQTLVKNTKVININVTSIK